MTANQIAYWTLLESRRSNKAREDLTNSQNVENKRHNIQTENLGRGNLNELVRHNQSTEALQHNANKEIQRHNVATEKFNISSLAESTRHNKANERETNRHNLVGEQFSWSTLGETKRLNDSVIGRNQQETAKSEAQMWDIYTKNPSALMASGIYGYVDSNGGSTIRPSQHKWDLSNITREDLDRLRKKKERNKRTHSGGGRSFKHDIMYVIE